MAYSIGLDIGITSVGYAVLALDYNEEPWGIIRMGSRIFDAAEHPKDGSSLAAPRREARSARRRLRRKHHRIERIKALLIKEKLLSQEELDNLYNGQLSDIYELRTKALDKIVSNRELARILLHLAQRRGFKSNRKADATDKEAGQLLTAVNDNRLRMQQNGYRTVGEMFFKDEFFKEYKRNKGGSYLTTIHRDMIKEETEKIFAAQKLLGNKLLTKQFLDTYLDILLGQRQFDEGPGEPSPYSGAQIEKMIGRCTFETGEFRAAKASYSFEYFNLLQKINHLRLLDNGLTKSLDEIQRKKIIDLAYSKADLKYSQIRKALGLGEKVLFNTLDYSDGMEKVEKKTKFNFVPAFHEMRKVLDKVAPGRINSLTKEQLNAAGWILTTYKGDERRREEFQKFGLDKIDIEALLTIGSFSKYGHLSVKALDKIIPYLEQGLNYDEACVKAGYNFKGHANGKKDMLLPANNIEMEDVTSPVVRRAIAQTIKVINAIIREQGSSPSYINIELAREMAKDFDERKELKKRMEENHAKNDRLMDRIKNEFHKAHPTGMDLVKLKLYEEQDGVCPYSLKQMKVERLFEPGYVDVDHIVPYSICFNDTYKNKVLVMTEENRQKGNRLPLQYLKGERADKFKVWVNNNVHNYRKRQLLLKEQITEEDMNKFKERNLQDTKTMSRFLYNYINDYLQFATSTTGKKKHVTAVNGSVTAHLRKRWGINKNRADGDTHHAVDAVVIACTTDKMIKDISWYSQFKELEYTQDKKETVLANTKTGQIVDRFPYPWPDFRAELMARLTDNPSIALKKLHLLYYSDKDLSTIKPIFVSRMPRHKVTGAAHKDTVKSPRLLDEGLVLAKKNLTDLKLKNGEIENYYAPESDMILYNALKQRLLAFNGDVKEAFKEPFYKPKADGSQGPLVKKVKLFEKATLTVPVQNGTAVAENDSMVRVDVFKVEGDGYYLVPIYVADTLKKELPNKAIVANKPYSKWKEMKEEDFIFSLYPNDLIMVTHNKGMTFTNKNKESTLPKEFRTKETMAYYAKTGISTASIKIVNDHNTYEISSLGVKSLSNFEKYQVDVLGNYTKVNREKRQTFH
jgi:CRISPR-associated endonuclease Csn1